MYFLEIHEVLMHRLNLINPFHTDLVKIPVNLRTCPATTTKVVWKKTTLGEIHKNNSLPIKVQFFFCILKVIHRPLIVFAIKIEQVFYLIGTLKYRLCSAPLYNIPMHKIFKK